MIALLCVSLIWGFSFGLIKLHFVGFPAELLAALRLLIALPCFLWVFRPRVLPGLRPTVALLAIGAAQYGVMYLALFAAFAWLQAYEVALLTVFTPAYIVLFESLRLRAWPSRTFWLCAVMAIVGAIVIFAPSDLPAKLPGILLMQLSNLAFAGGQVAWRDFSTRFPAVPATRVYALLFAGGVLLTLPYTLARHAPSDVLAALSALSATQWWVLAYLGSIASGLAFFLWNFGAARVNSASLAVMNNLKIPLATLVSVFAFGETAQWHTLLPGMAILVLSLLLANQLFRRNTA